MTGLAFLSALPARHDQGERLGLTSVCSAHPEVIRAALEAAHEAGQPALIEATCNQVNQEGGYTGLTPGDFAARVRALADEAGLAPMALVLGSDHLGPNPWRALPAAAAMEKAEAMARAYGEAGFAKIHADASMACVGDPAALPVRTIAERAARLVAAAEAGSAAAGHPPPVYIIGTEVPVPGGAAEELGALVPTAPDAAAETVAVHREVFEAAGLGAALTRVIGLVVQPGVEFGHANVVPFAPEGAAPLARWRDRLGGLVFEAHSTDYQTPAALAALVADGFAILKVGPALTFALREALYGLDAIAGALVPGYGAGSLPAAMEALMLAEPSDWAAYYHGDDAAWLRHFSYSDRIRYYWTRPEAEAAVAALIDALGSRDIPEGLVSQYLPRLCDAVAAGTLPPRAGALMRGHVRLALAPYLAACTQRP